MRRIVASLAIVLASVAAFGLAACGGDDAEPDAPQDGAVVADQPSRIDLVLDFQPNAVHTGIYAAEQRELLAAAGIDLEVRAPGASTDAPKLLRTGGADLAILDIHDLAIAREQGLDLIGVAAIVQRPLAAVIAGDPDSVRSPADLAGAKVGITGLPSDDAVLESVLAAGGLSAGDVDTVTIGFESVPALLSGRLDAATAFWNAEGVTLQETIPTREFRVDQFGAPRYPELILATTPATLESEREAIEATVAAIDEGYALTVADPETGLQALTEAVPELDPETQRAQLDAVLPAFGASRALDREVLGQWARWDAERGIVETPPVLEETFDFGVARAPGD